MNKCDKLKELYLSDINNLENTLKNNAAKLMAEDSKDEAILENIKLNIVDIFNKMFNISFNKACKNVVDEAESLGKLKEEYFKFFDKLPAPWKIKMAKDLEHNMMEEYYKEKIKLETVEQMKDSFLEHYNSFTKEA